MSREGRRPLSRLIRDEEGQMLVLFALMVPALIMFLLVVFNVGEMVGERMRTQNIADAAAYSGAVWEARTLNFIAYTNRTIIAHIVTATFITSMEASSNIYRDIANVTSWIPYVNVATRTISQAYTVIVRVANIVRNLIPIYNTSLYLAQIGMMGASIGSHQTVMENVAHQIDPAVEVNRGTAGTVAWGRNIMEFNRIMRVSASDGNSLARIAMASRDGFSRGSSFPRTWNISFMQIFRAGLSGDSNITSRRIRAQDFFRIQRRSLTWRGFRWKTITSLRSQPATYNYNLNNVRFINYRTNSNPSVYAVVRKPSSRLSQINLFGLTPSTHDLYTVARAEVYYRRPDRPSEEPNLFNPFWKVKLSPLDNTWGRGIVTLAGADSGRVVLPNWIDH